ncbi:MAG TPA: FHA domain-containing protein [Pirellulales bacterium]|nr:FHA domain-containing protein [Pirellulales bacterium]
MADLSNPNAPDSSLHAAIHLMDSALGRPIRSWQFSGQPLISIGRADDRDVQISDPYVSRNHAELRNQCGQWSLVSLGRHGVIVQGETIAEIPIQGETTFRLGSSGPTLRFDPRAPHADNRMTMMFDSTVGENMFELDHSKLQREVAEIADGDYFLELQRRAQQLRQQRQ